MVDGLHTGRMTQVWFVFVLGILSQLVTAEEGLFLAKPLPYGCSGLEPQLSRSMLKRHHDHYRQQLKTLNQMLEGIGIKDTSAIEEIMEDSYEWNKPLYHRAAESFNHEFYFKCMTTRYLPPSDLLLEQIERDFGNFIRFRFEFQKAGNRILGSGWTWLVYDKLDEALRIEATVGADNPMSLNKHHRPILAMDMWEHAFLPDFKNKKDYTETFISTLVDWQFVEEMLEKAKLEVALAEEQLEHLRVHEEEQQEKEPVKKAEVEEVARQGNTKVGLVDQVMVERNIVLEGAAQEQDVPKTQVVALDEGTDVAKEESPLPTLNKVLQEATTSSSEEGLQINNEVEGLDKEQEYSLDTANSCQGEETNEELGGELVHVDKTSEEKILPENQAVISETHEAKANADGDKQGRMSFLDVLWRSKSVGNTLPGIETKGSLESETPPGEKTHTWRLLSSKNTTDDGLDDNPTISVGKESPSVEQSSIVNDDRAKHMPSELDNLRGDLDKIPEKSREESSVDEETTADPEKNGPTNAIMKMVYFVWGLIHSVLKVLHYIWSLG